MGCGGGSARARGSIVPTVGADGHRLALGHADLQDARAGGADTTLLALSVSSSKSGSPALTERAVGLEPAREDAFGDRFAHARGR